MIAKPECLGFLLAILVVRTAALASPTEYRYFAYGSNMSPSTLTALRSVHPLDSTAAILPGYKLRFNIRGIPLLEGSFASVEENKSSAVHGVLYTLSDKNFARIGSTEGVPFAYKWQRCKVHPYLGDGNEAGCNAVEDVASVSAWTLVSTFPRDADSPPSRGYLDILVDSAKEWNLDKAYVEELQAKPVARTIGKGLAGNALKVAKWRQSMKKRT